MKKVLIVVIALVLAAASVFGVVTYKNSISAKSNFSIDEKSSMGEIVEFYKNSVKNSKECKNFSLDVTTSVRLDEINGPNVILNETLSTIMGYKQGDERAETQSYSFENGIDINDSSVTPLSVIQPADSYIESFNEASLLLKDISCKNDYASISFEIKNETADLDSVVAAINPIVKGQTVTDKSQITALAPRHSEFIDVGNVISTVVDMLGISEMVNGSDKNDNSSKKLSVGISDGKCTIGNTELSVYADNNNLLNTVIITVPVELKAGFNLMNNVTETSVCITVVQSYVFNY